MLLLLLGHFLVACRVLLVVLICVSCPGVVKEEGGVVVGVVVVVVQTALPREAWEHSGPKLGSRASCDRARTKESLERATVNAA